MGRQVIITLSRCMSVSVTSCHNVIFVDSLNDIIRMTICMTSRSVIVIVEYSLNYNSVQAGSLRRNSFS